MNNIIWVLGIAKNVFLNKNHPKLAYRANEALMGIQSFAQKWSGLLEYAYHLGEDKKYIKIFSATYIIKWAMEWLSICTDVKSGIPFPEKYTKCKTFAANTN